MKRNAYACNRCAWLSLGSVIVAGIALSACSSSNCPNGRMGDTGACLAEPATPVTMSNAATGTGSDADSAADGGKTEPDERATDAG